MADNLKPYNPNKGFISFRLNPEAIKEEALNLIPWPVGTIAREMYRDPDGSAIETAKQVGRETPVLGSILAGEPTDAAKEAFLFGMPIKAGPSKKAINKLPSDTQFKRIQGYDRAYSPSTGKNWKLVESDGKLLPVEDHNYNPANFRVDNSPAYNASQINDFIDNTNALEKLNKNDKLRLNPERIDNPYDFDRLQDPAFANSIEGKLLKEGDDLTARWSGRGPRSVSLEQRVKNSKAANILSSNLKKGESLLQDKYGNLVVKDKNGKYWHKQINLNTGKIVDEYTVNYTDKLNPYSDPMLSKDIKDYNADVKLYNAKYGDEDSFINFKDPRDWQSDVYDARDAYLNSIYGPFYEDIMGIERLY